MVEQLKLRLVEKQSDKTKQLKVGKKEKQVIKVILQQLFPLVSSHVCLQGQIDSHFDLRFFAQSKIRMKKETKFGTRICLRQNKKNSIQPESTDKINRNRKTQSQVEQQLGKFS